MTNALPVPTPEEVESFRELYLREFGKEITREEAWEVSTRVLRLFCLATYGLPPERSPEETPLAKRKGKRHHSGDGKAL